MKYISHLKYNWWTVVIIVGLLFSIFSTHSSYYEMNRLKIKLLAQEKQLTSIFKKRTEMNELINDLEKIKKIKSSYCNEIELNRLIEETINPQSSSYSEVKNDFKIGSRRENSTLIHYPFKLQVESSFNCIGDYLEYLESSYLPLSVHAITIAPAVYEFDLIKAQLTGTIYLPK